VKDEARDEGGVVRTGLFDEPFDQVGIGRRIEPLVNGVGQELLQADFLDLRYPCRRMAVLETRRRPEEGERLDPVRMVYRQLLRYISAGRIADDVHDRLRPGQAAPGHRTPATKVKSHPSASGFGNCHDLSGQASRPDNGATAAAPTETSAGNCPSLRAGEGPYRAFATDR